MAGQRRAFTLVELLIVIAVISVLYSATFYVLKPDNLKAKARDGVRLADLGSLQTLIENYIADNGFPPDSDNVLRKSYLSVNPQVNPARSDGGGWLGINFGNAVEKLPTDPLNSGEYFYRYIRLGQKYELDGKLEFYASLMKGDEDGGNSETRLEKGTDLNLLGD